VVKPASALVLSPDESAALCNRLVGEIADLQSQESATSWARGALAAKTAGRHRPDQGCPQALESDARNGTTAISTTGIASGAWCCCVS
jgi:hypothetical protein